MPSPSAVFRSSDQPVSFLLVIRLKINCKINNRANYCWRIFNSNALFRLYSHTLTVDIAQCSNITAQISVDMVNLAKIWHASVANIRGQ